MATSGKRGRKLKPFITKDGKHINGLRRRENDGRWVMFADGRMFSEHDEDGAVRRFYQLTGTYKPTLGQVYAQTGDLIQNHIGTFAGKLGAVIAAATAEEQKSDGYVLGEIPERRIWEYFAAEVRRRPAYVAKMTGIEQIGYLDKLQSAAKLPTFKELEQAWQDHADCGVEEKRKVLAAWRDFAATTGVGGIKDITPQSAIAYGIRQRQTSSGVSRRTESPMSKKSTTAKTIKKATTKAVAKKPTKPKAAAFVNPYRIGGAYHATVEALLKLGMGKMHALDKVVPACKNAMGDAFKDFAAKQSKLSVDDRIKTNIQVPSRKDYGEPLREVGYSVRWDGRAKTAGLFKM